MDLVLEIINKDPDKIMVIFGKTFQCISVYLVAEIWDVLIIDGDKLFNMFKVTVGEILCILESLFNSSMLVRMIFKTSLYFFCVKGIL